MLVEIPAHQFQHEPDLDWDVHSSMENSRDCFSHLNLVLDKAKILPKLLFCTEKIFLSNKLTKEIDERRLTKEIDERD